MKRKFIRFRPQQSILVSNHSLTFSFSSSVSSSVSSDFSKVSWWTMIVSESSIIKAAPSNLFRILRSWVLLEYIFEEHLLTKVNIQMPVDFLHSMRHAIWFLEARQNIQEQLHIWNSLRLLVDPPNFELSGCFINFDLLCVLDQRINDAKL